MKDEKQMELTRIRWLVQGIVNNDTTASMNAVLRIEQYLVDILSNRTSTLTPVTRIEHYLAKISGMNVDIPTPVTRIEKYLFKVAGGDIEVPTPVTPAEQVLAEWAEAGGGTQATVTGTLPLTIANAISKAIVSLTRYGLCTQASTPTPSDPVDIKCNNGALTMVDDELPDGYKRVLGFQCNNNAYWGIPNFPMNGSDTLRFSFEATDACNVIGAYSGSASGNNYSLYVSPTANYLRYKSGAYNSTVDFDTRYDVEITPTGTSGMKVNSTWTAQTFTTPTNFCIGTTSPTASSSKLKGNLYGNIEVVGRAKFIPCERLSDNILGYYDMYSETFFEPAAGFDGSTSLGYDRSHYVLRTVGTPEVLTVGDQTATVPDLYAVGDYKDEVDIISGTVTRRVGVKVCDGTESWQKVTGYNAYYAILDDMRYCNPTEAGFSTHFVGNGSATASMPNNTVKLSYTSGGTGAIMFKCNAYTTIADWTAFVAAQYAAGTPVIVIYPLATETTESVAGQSLSTAAGTNVVDSVANVSPLEADVVYMASNS